MAPSPANPENESLEPYRQAIARTGSGFAATLWASERTQKLRFDVLLDLVGTARLRDSVVLDLGCGDGALAAHLLERSIGYQRYVGVDGLREQVEAGSRRELPSSSFLCSDLLASPRSLGQWGADIAIISGTLNTMSQEVAMAFVTEVFGVVRHGVVFNFLSSRPAPERLEADLGPAVRHDVLGWIDHALTLSPLVGFRQDHLDGHDAAIVIRHGT
jgi:SAM-dependent methyltransferase